MDALFKECKTQAASRRDDLINSQEWFAFQRSANDVSEWMLEKQQVALSEEYGRDLEHVDLLIQSFNDFQHNLANSEGKVSLGIWQTVSLMYILWYHGSCLICGDSHMLEDLWT